MAGKNVLLNHKKTIKGPRLLLKGNNSPTRGNKNVECCDNLHFIRPNMTLRDFCGLVGLHANPRESNGEVVLERMVPSSSMLLLHNRFPGDCFF